MWSFAFEDSDGSRLEVQHLAREERTGPVNIGFVAYHRGLPVNDGTGSGVTIPYDLGFQVENRSRSAGGSADFFWSPIIKRKRLKVRPLAGARYVYIGESFEFTGVDSGFLYGGFEEAGDMMLPVPYRDLKVQSPPNQFDDNGDFIAALGSPGGSRIIGYVAQSLIAVLDHGLSMQEAFDLPHHVNRNGATDLEEDTAIEALAPKLTAMGHEVRSVTMTSGLHGIMIRDGALDGGADKRREGVVLDGVAR